MAETAALRDCRALIPLGVGQSSACGRTAFGANEAQVADDFIAMAMVRWRVDAGDRMLPQAEIASYHIVEKVALCITAFWPIQLPQRVDAVEKVLVNMDES
jgi:hypothetical protein